MNRIKKQSAGPNFAFVKGSSSKRIRADVTLLFVAMIWGSAFVAQRSAAAQMNIFIFNGLRFLLAAIVLLPFVLWGRRLTSRNQPNIKAVAGIILAGLVLFVGASFQQWGLKYTTAGNAGFITGLYVVFVPLILAIGWRQIPHRSVFVAAMLASVGLFLLSTGFEFRLAPGDGLELWGALLWAFHVILLGFLVMHAPAFDIAFGQNLVCGVLSVLVGIGFGPDNPWEGISQGLWAIIYTGLLSIAVGYTMQIVAQKDAPPSDAAVILSMEAVFAAFFGAWFLKESLSQIQLLGCILIVMAIILAQLSQRRRLLYAVDKPPRDG